MKAWSRRSLHKGPYDDEPATVTILDGYARSQGYGLVLLRRPPPSRDLPIRPAPMPNRKNLKTIIRHPVVKVG